MIQRIPREAGRRVGREGTNILIPQCPRRRKFALRVWSRTAQKRVWLNTHSVTNYRPSRREWLSNLPSRAQPLFDTKLPKYSQFSRRARAGNCATGCRCCRDSEPIRNRPKKKSLHKKGKVSDERINRCWRQIDFLNIFYIILYVAWLSEKT